MMLTGPKKALLQVKEHLKKSYELKAEILGWSADETQEVEFLGRQIRLTKSGIEYEAGRKHVGELLQSWALTEANGVTTPGVSSQKQDDNDTEEPMSNEKATKYRRCAAILNYLSQDRCDISFATKEIARSMARPNQSDEVKLKRALRYLLTHPRGIYHFPFQNEPEEITCFIDSDWAGCSKTRKSTSGGTTCLGRHLGKLWSSTQTVISLSVGEAEYYGIVKGSAMGKGTQSVLLDMGLESKW